MKCSKLRLLSFLGMIILTPFFPSFIVKASASTQDEPIIKILRSINAFISGEGGEDSQDGRDSNYKLPSFPRQKKYENGDRYKGGWKNKAPDGVGEMTYNNGDYYIGEWKKGCKEGTGRITYINGDVYEGEWKNNMKQGVGQMIYGNGDSYEGGWVNDQRSGKGVMKYASRDIYDGEWKENMRSGKGVMSYYHGNNYNGLWINDKPSGYGVLKNQNGDSVSGNWINGLLEEGEYVIKNKYTFKGRFNRMMINVSSDLGHGFKKGRLTEDEHNYLEGVWNGFNLDSGVVSIHKADLVVQGSINDGIFDGEITIPSKFSFVGTYDSKEANGHFIAGEYEFDGLMQQWFPAEGVLLSPKISIKIINGVCEYGYNNKKYSVASDYQSAEGLFNYLEKEVNKTNSFFEKYLKGKCFVNNREYDGPIRTKEVLYFTENGLAIKKWNNYYSRQESSSSNSKKGKGRRTCPVCYGEGEVFDEDWVTGIRTYHKCYICSGRGYITRDNAVGWTMTELEGDMVLLHTKVKDENGKWEYVDKLKGQGIFDYTVNGNVISFNGEQYVVKDGTLKHNKYSYNAQNLSDDDLIFLKNTISSASNKKAEIGGKEITHRLCNNELFLKVRIFKPQKKSQPTRQVAKESIKSVPTVDQSSFNNVVITCKTDFEKWFNSQLRYPEEAKENGVMGRVLAQFTVTRDGHVINARITRGVDPLLDNEVLRVINMCPKWGVDENNATDYDTTYEFPVTFFLN